MAAYYTTWTRDGRVFSKTHHSRKEAHAHRDRLVAEGVQVSAGRYQDNPAARRYVRKDAQQLSLPL